MGQWMISEQGQAIAAWGANILSLVALGTALTVAIVERRRSQRELMRTAEQEKARRQAFVNTALAISEQAVSLMRTATTTFVQDFNSGDRRLSPVGLANQLERVLRPLNDAARALQQAAPFDANIAVSLSRICRAMEGAWDDTIAHQGGYGGNLERRTDDIEVAQKLLREEIVKE